MSAFRPPVRARKGRFVIDLGVEESALVLRLLGELRAMLTDDDPSDEVRLLTARLFPVVHPDDEEAEEEYQRLMRDELVRSKLGAFEVIESALGGEDDDATTRVEVDEVGLTAFMQSVNSVRLVLGTMLGVTDDPDAEEVAPGYANSPEYALYGYLSYLLEHAVRAASAAG